MSDVTDTDREKAIEAARAFELSWKGGSDREYASGHVDALIELGWRPDGAPVAQLTDHELASVYLQRPANPPVNSDHVRRLRLVVAAVTEARKEAHP